MNYYEDRKLRVNKKIDSFRDHTAYTEWLRKYTDDALCWVTTGGYLQIKADDFLKRIDAAPLSIIRDWLDGKNQLEWELIKESTE